MSGHLPQGTLRKTIQWVKDNHLLLSSIAWWVLLIPTFIWFKDSVFWVILVSHYANSKTDLGAWHAKRAERKADESG